MTAPLDKDTLIQLCQRVREARRCEAEANSTAQSAREQRVVAETQLNVAINGVNWSKR